MKKLLLLLLALPMFVLYGCSGGGSIDAPTASVPPGGGGDVTAGLQEIKFTFDAVEGAPKALIDKTVNNIRNGARIVVLQVTEVTHQEEIFDEVCTWEPDVDGWYQRCIQVPFDPPQYLQLPSTFDETFKAVNDAVLDANGAGTISINVPPGENYTLDLFTYVSGNLDVVYACSDTNYTVALCPEAETVTITSAVFTKAPMTSTTLNLMDQCYYSWEAANVDTEQYFDVLGGQTNTVTVVEDTIAAIVLPVEVDSGATYQVSSTRSPAVRDLWYVRQGQTSETTLLATDWFIREDVELGVAGSGSNGTISLQAEVTGSPGSLPLNQWTLWHHGQFFAASKLLQPGEDFRNWTYGTSSDAYRLNPDGIVDVIIVPLP